MASAERFSTDAYRSLFADIAAVRAHRASFLETIESGSTSLEVIFETAASDPVVSGMKVLPVIEGLPDAGKVQTRRAFEEVGIDEADHIGSVSAAAIDGLPAALAKHER